MTFNHALAGLAILAAVGFAGCSKEHGGADAQKTTGHLQSAAGSLTGDDKLKREGKKNEVVGGVKDAVGDVKDAAHDATK